MSEQATGAKTAVAEAQATTTLNAEVERQVSAILEEAERQARTQAGHPRDGLPHPQPRRPLLLLLKKVADKSPLPKG